MVDQSIVKAVRSYLHSLQEHGIGVSFGVVFGSRAAGGASDWSDIDLVVVSSRFDRPRSRQDVALLWRLTAQTDNRIEPIACGEIQWNEDDSSPIIEIARREGEMVFV